jgi:hypothetical protein
MKEVGVFEILSSWLSYRVMGVVATGKLKRWAGKQIFQGHEYHAKMFGFYSVK